MRRFRLIIAMLLTLALPLQGLAAVAVHVCEQQSGPHAGISKAGDSMSGKMDCCSKTANCVQSGACAGVTLSAVIQSVGADFDFSPAFFKPSGAANPQLAAHAHPLYRPPIALLS